MNKRRGQSNRLGLGSSCHRACCFCVVVALVSLIIGRRARLSHLHDCDCSQSDCEAAICISRRLRSQSISGGRVTRHQSAEPSASAKPRPRPNPSPKTSSESAARPAGSERKRARRSHLWRYLWRASWPAAALSCESPGRAHRTGGLKHESSGLITFGTR